MEITAFTFIVCGRAIGLELKNAFSHKLEQPEAFRKPSALRPQTRFGAQPSGTRLLARRSFFGSCKMAAKYKKAIKTEKRFLARRLIQRFLRK